MQGVSELSFSILLPLVVEFVSTFASGVVGPQAYIFHSITTWHSSMARVNGPPPGRSIYDATPASQSSHAIKDNAPTVPEAQDVDAVSRATKELSSTARSDHQRIDLTELLSQTSRESSYSEVPAGVRMHRLTQSPRSLQ